MKTAIFANNPKDSYSGGRYLSLVMAECLAYRGHQVYYVTNNEPLFFKDFEIYENHGSVNLIITDNFLVKPMERQFDLVILIPHQNPNPHFYDAVRHFAQLTAANLVLFNFETPNWFNRYSPVKRNENTWTQWKKSCEQGCLVLSMTGEAQKYARRYYTDNPGQTYFDFWYPALNTRAADKITVSTKEKRVVIISRLEDKHKGGNDILEAIDQALAGYTLVFILGRGQIQEQYRQRLEDFKKKYHLHYEVHYRLSDEDKFREIKRAQLMLFPSYFEGYGYPPLEALYCGTPCVAYDLPVLRETCKEGILYARIGDINDFKEKIKQALTLNDGANFPPTDFPGIGSFESRARQLEEILLKYAGVKFNPGKVPILKPNFIKQTKRFLQKEKNRIKEILSIGGKRKRLEAPFCDTSLKYALSEIKSTGNNELKIKGWVFAEKKIDTVSIFADSKFLGKLPVHLHRQDVYDKFKTCLHLDCGFSGQIPFDSPPVFNLKLEFYAQSHALAIIEKSVNLNPDNSTLSGPGTGQRESWLSLKTDDSPGMKRRVELANRGKGLTENDRRIGAFYNKHKGEIAFLIGNGPSVRVEDLEKLHNAVTFGCNRLYLAYDRMAFRPTYLCSTDHQMIKDFGAEMVEKHPGTVLFVAPERPRIAGDFVWFPMKSRTPIEFSENVYDFVMPGGGTLIAAMQMGYHMGITRFVLYGVDHHFHYEKNKNASGVLESARGDGNHFIPDYRSGKPWTPPLVFQVEGAFLSCHVFLQSKNGWVKNATRGGQLAILERIDFDEIVPGGWHPQPIHGQPDAVLSGASSQKFAEKTKLHKVSIKEGWHPQPIHGQPDAVLSRAASQKFAEKTNLHKVKRSPGKTTTSRGKIKWFTARKQFGFIQPHQGEEILFVHKKFIMNPDPEDLQVGTPVCYEPYQGPKGLEARNLRLLPEKIRR